MAWEKFTRAMWERTPPRNTQAAIRMIHRSLLEGAAASNPIGNGTDGTNLEICYPLSLARNGGYCDLAWQGGSIGRLLDLRDIEVWTDYRGCKFTLNPSILSILMQLYLNGDLLFYSNCVSKW